MTISEQLKGKICMITGGVGTVGVELIKQVLSYEPAEVRVIDNNETGVFFLEERFGRSYRDYAGAANPSASRFTAYVGDVRDSDKLNRMFEGVDIVFHCAALKHVILCERSPFDAIQSNILGVKNVIDAANLNNVARVVFTSSDKAVNPTSVMGTSKLMGERLITAANTDKNSRSTVFSSTRFGNVIGSRGSVLQIFYDQIKAGGPVTLTDDGMTRFVMTVEEAVSLVLESSTLARGGEVFVSKMPVIRIKDLARAMIDTLAPRFGRDPGTIAVRQIGKKAGEKLFEELMTQEEISRAWELRTMFAIMPAFRSAYREIAYDYPEILSKTVGNPYVSDTANAMSPGELREYIDSRGLVQKLMSGDI